MRVGWVHWGVEDGEIRGICIDWQLLMVFNTKGWAQLGVCRVNRRSTMPGWSAVNLTNSLVNNVELQGPHELQGVLSLPSSESLSIMQLPGHAIF
jgi:hypothetical protein